MDKKKALKWVGIYLLVTLIGALAYYFALPAINVFSEGFWFFLAFLIFIYTLPLTGVKVGVEILKAGQIKPRVARPQKGKGKWMLLALLPVAVVLLGTLVSSTFFNAKRYAAVIDVNEAVFSEDMPETENVTNIALMDSATAAIVGNRTLGSLSDVVSQFEIAPSYTQINFERTPQKVANLEYAGFFKWLGNREEGLPGYVMVDPVNNTAEYKALSVSMRYVDSAYFGEDLSRRLRFDYPTKILGTPSFEVDDEGNPYFIVPCYRPRVGLFGASDVSEVIIFDPTDGSSEIFSLDATPAWIDIVYDGYLATEKYNWKGLLSGGFWNSVIGNKDCKQTTDDFGYIVIGDDVWYFTGVTSVNSDQSNIGFIISNARTGEYKFYSVIGAEEHSAMTAAQGEVQHMNYTASFPALINVRGEATYIMVLKDAGGLVKLYALVNVEQYNIVATGATQEDAKNAYLEKLVTEGVLSPEDVVTPEDPDGATAEEFVLTVDAITPVVTAGESWLYLRGVTDAGKTVLVKSKIAENESVLLLSVGDAVSVKATPTENESVYTLISFGMNG
ncbi:MAG: hypothetical protein IJV96_03390 [Clostridia bacterium]|nr:hypothetical protein [Clostridia bacterium]